MTISTKKQEPRLSIGILACIGGLFTQLVTGSIYQWGIISIYITSYFKLNDQSLTLESTSIASPLLLITTGLTITLGLYLARITHPLIVLGVSVVLQAAFTFISSYMTNFWLFILFFGILFGVTTGFGFMIPILQCNKYLVGKKMFVNGFILVGSGLGSVIFGEFSYNYINPNRLAPNNGYYIGNADDQQLISHLPSLIRWLSLLYLVIGVFGTIMVAPVCLHNRRVQNEHQLERKEKEKQKQQKHQEKHPHSIVLPPIAQKQEHKNKHLTRHQRKHLREAHSILDAVKSKIFWLSNLILFFGSIGVFLITTNYKTYVKSTIHDDQFLTTIGVIGSVGNGCSRFFWNLYFNKTGYKTVLLTVLTLCAIVFATIRFTVEIKQIYLIEIFIMNCCLGGFLVSTPTAGQSLYGHSTGSSVFGINLEVFASANLIAYVYISQLSHVIGINNVIYICLALVVVSFAMVIVTKFQGPWQNDVTQLQFCYGIQMEKKTNGLNQHQIKALQHLTDVIESNNILLPHDDKTSKQDISTTAYMPSAMDIKASNKSIAEKESKEHAIPAMDNTSLKIINESNEDTKEIQQTQKIKIHKYQNQYQNIRNIESHTQIVENPK